MRMPMMLAATLIAAPAAAQTVTERTPVIQVVGTATVPTRPDRAQIVYWINGEGQTADAASTALAAKQQAIVAGLSALLGRDTQLTSGDVSVMEVRAPQCDGPGNYTNRPRLSEGVCAVTGWVATLQGTVRTAAVDKAATAAGLAARLGARDARVQGFSLSDPAAAQRRATAAAIASARVKAEAMAAGSGVKLGELLSLSDQNGGGDAVIAEDIGHLSLAAARVSAPPPVEIAITPRSIETQARVFARYAIVR